VPPAPIRDGAVVSIVLSPGQVDHVLRVAAGVPPGAPSAAMLLAGLPAGDALARRAADPRLSRSLLRGLALLARVGADDAREHGIVELAGELRMSASTAHRYAQTLVELGLLERCADTRRYRVARH
jgi:hypothetical protein